MEILKKFRFRYLKIILTSFETSEKSKMTEKIEPHILRKFEIVQKIGKGAYGIVWKAIDKKYK